MVPLTPVRLIACATGVAAEGSRREIAADDRASVAFVQRVGVLAHLDHDTGRSTWPMPDAATAMEWARFGLTAGVLHDRPAPGDIALRWDRQRGAFVHAAIVAHLEGEDGRARTSGRDVKCRLLYGNGSGARARIGFLKPQMGDRFLRWADLPPADRAEGRDESIERQPTRRAA